MKHVDTLCNSDGEFISIRYSFSVNLTCPTVMRFWFAWVMFWTVWFLRPLWVFWAFWAFWAFWVFWASWSIRAWRSAWSTTAIAIAIAMATLLAPSSNLKWGELARMAMTNLFFASHIQRNTVVGLEFDTIDFVKSIVQFHGCVDHIGNTAIRFW